MGRTLRRRLRKKKHSRLPINKKYLNGFVQFIEWLAKNGWKPVCKLLFANFQLTGNGLMAKQKIKSGDIIVKIPENLLITVRSVSRSMFGFIFHKGNSFTTQQVLSAFLVLEKHLGSESFWEKYITLLPESIATPVFCSPDVLHAMPSDIAENASAFKSHITDLFKQLVSTLSDSDVCPHCAKSIADILELDSFLWAWFMVNSRAVYISPERNTDHSIILCDSNCLALAPYLDLFNHSNEAQVQAFVNDIDGSYQIKTMIPFNKNQQVFIHYGSHSNLKLLIEYGFILKHNTNDAVQFTFSDVLKSFKEIYPEKNSPSKVVYNFLKSHDILVNLHCSVDGLSWNTKILIYVLIFSENIDPKVMQIKVFSNDFSNEEMKRVFLVAEVLTRLKYNQLKEQYDCMLKMGPFSCNPGFVNTVHLICEYINVINKNQSIIKKLLADT